ncbi:hypothetical protein [Fodinicola feengrottensis]|uniref:hypothetical protein n=1 Tax=Fodinicola feengrottensis TaxID=435914 RepID=UPI0024425A29|nr:hypothetical protein [Fodinicola feengrottensis]
MLRLSSRVVTTVAALALFAGPAPAHADYPRHRAHSAAEVAAHVVPAGGIKSAMTGGNTVGGGRCGS